MEHTRSTYQRLPVELWIHVVGHISEKRDVAKLCLVSTLLNSISLPFLYQNLNISMQNGREWDRQLSLFRTLQIPRYSNIVTTLEITLSGGYVCAKILDRDKSCTCEVYDREVGNFLSALRNLRSLYFRCRLCRANGRHSYLDTLQTRQLRVFRFSCSCLTSQIGESNEPNPTSLLNAPFMQAVTSMALACSNRWLIDDTGTISSVLRNPDVLPSLNTLGYIVSSDSGIFRFPNEFLAARPIQRLYYPGPPLLSYETPPTQQTLECLMTNDVMQWLSPIVTKYPDLYANLRCLGTITLLSSKEENILHALEPLSVLKLLHTIELNQFISGNTKNTGDIWSWENKFEPFEPSDSLVQRLGQQNDSLRRIYHVHRPYWDVQRTDATLWERNHDDMWTRRAIPFMDHWEVVNGALDSL
ncbi:hypothetical protein M408DRAFT_25152 [Serendipita vermifera MAFF 305830]|uniref:F-box domain-containing protein n=1 Tax=Serendipita vermifera MAFF 305830 TaxID=933852 RepID=A0A0C2WK10_SERVB|nr:hypothetical protein M408DRAFT_25152 [Serendipita vermifera MAFF 305830]